MPRKRSIGAIAARNSFIHDRQMNPTDQGGGIDLLERSSASPHGRRENENPCSARFAEGQDGFVVVNQQDSAGHRS